MTAAFWYAERNRELASPFVWQPCLDTGEGTVASFQIGFDSKEACEEWIRQNVIGAGLEGDE